jgi:UDP-N-acetylmuramoylalanine--D-glutamate ligase
MKKSDYIDNFKDKKITMMGLGLLGRGVNVAKFLAECGAELIITDLKDKDELAESLKKLRNTRISSTYWVVIVSVNSKAVT